MQKLYTKLITSIILLLFAVNQADAGHPLLDFDGDGKTDIAVVRHSNEKLIWYISRSRDGFYSLQWGATPNDRSYADGPMPKDYDGDGRTDIAVRRCSFLYSSEPNYFYILRSSDNTLQVVQWGLCSDTFVLQDYDGDGKTDPAVARDVNGKKLWFILESTTNQMRVEYFGTGADESSHWLTGDFDGDGRGDLAVMRKPLYGGPYDPRPMTFYIRRSSDNSLYTVTLGDDRADFIAPGDYDGDGKTDVAVWRGRNEFGGSAFWYWIRSRDGQLGAVKWGQLDDGPVPGDYDGDGTTDVAVVRSNGTSTSPKYFYILGSTRGVIIREWGLASDPAVGL